MSRQSALLLMMFDDLAQSRDRQRRGYLLQELVQQLFDVYQIPVVRPFTRNEGAEQIEFEGWHYVAECRWREKPADIRELDGLKGQVQRSGKQTMGLFLSINGWSDHVPSLLKQSTSKDIILMDGYDVRCEIARQVDLVDLLLAKIAKLNNDAEPFLSVKDLLWSAMPNRTRKEAAFQTEYRNSATPFTKGMSRRCIRGSAMLGGHGWRGRWSLKIAPTSFVNAQHFRSKGGHIKMPLTMCVQAMLVGYATECLERAVG